MVHGKLHAGALEIHLAVVPISIGLLCHYLGGYAYQRVRLHTLSDPSAPPGQSGCLLRQLGVEDANRC